MKRAPEATFVKAPDPGGRTDGMQRCGMCRWEGKTGRMTATLRDRVGVALWSTTLDPKLG